MTKLVARFEIHFTQILDAHAHLCAPLPACATHPALLIALYRTMLLTRLFDKKAIALQRMGKMGTYPSTYGQEAISTAIGHLMQPDDVFIPYYRDYAAQLQRGVHMADILAYWGGDERGNHFASHDFPMCVPIASQCLHAAGVAFAFKHRQQPRVAVVSLGDGATSEGDFYEALNVASLWKLPLVFVINNNRWAISVPLSQQTAAQTLAQKAIAVGMRGEQVDGNDLLALHHVIGEAINKARAGEGPTLIEALSYRLSDHTTADDASRYQSAQELALAMQAEPLSRFKRFLEQHITWSPSQEEALHRSCEQEIQEAIEDYLNRTPQDLRSVFDHHFATLPDYLVEQRATALEDVLRNTQHTLSTEETTYA